MPVVLIVQAFKSADTSKTLDGIAADMRLSLEGEVQDLAGVLNNDAKYEVNIAQRAQGITAEGDWGYYAKQVASLSGQFLKAWIRWNIEHVCYDYYLDADAGTVFDHATPYVGTIY